MKKKKISPEKAKIISTFLVSIIFMAIVLSISNAYTKRMLKNAEDEYFNSIHTTLDGFSRIISIQLNNYKNALYSFYIDEVFEDRDVKKIYEFIRHYDYKKHEDFMDLYFLAPDGKAYLSNGQIVQMTPSKHKGLEGKGDCYISGICVPPGQDTKIFCIEQTLYKNGEIIGVLGASVIIDKFMQRTTGIKVGSREEYMLIDKDGYFLVHPRKDVIGLKYTPKEEKYNNASTENLAKLPPSTFVSLADDGSFIYLSTAKIPEAGWTLSLKVSLDEINAIYLPKKRTEIMIIFVSVTIILLLVLIEAKLLDFFQKKQLITTVYDPLTNLWTRQKFEKEATKLLRASPRSKFMLIEADIRGFKFINQNYGEDTGDKLLVYYANILRKYTNNFHAIIGRGFADHFYIFIKIDSVSHAMTNFKDLSDKLYKEIQNYEIPFFPKSGLSFFMPNKDSKDITIQNLIGRATFAKSTIKDNALTHYSIYNFRLQKKINEEIFIENHMQQALNAKEFFVMYQPKISLANDKIVGAEALVRWNSPKLGIMTPDSFIPVFERNGFIIKLDYYVYEEVFKFLQSRIKNGEPVVPISVNMSRNHDKPDKFMNDFMSIFNKYSISPDMIQLEILERSVMDNSTLQDITNKLHKEGFTVAMDDFGSGESSLNMLTKIPVDVLKFDREFLNAATNKEGCINKKSEKFIHILINLSKSLEKQTVFEGVETQAQRDFLRSIECDQAQGFFYSQPLKEEDFIQFINMHL
ncbi:MAG: GGDEF domain-containing protein [Treponema sp.]|nr:GGDEF domain-containing protein [Treponema sp.]